MKFKYIENSKEIKRQIFGIFLFPEILHLVIY